MGLETKLLKAGNGSGDEAIEAGNGSGDEAIESWDWVWGRGYRKLGMGRQ